MATKMPRATSRKQTIRSKGGTQIRLGPFGGVRTKGASDNSPLKLGPRRKKIRAKVK